MKEFRFLKTAVFIFLTISCFSCSNSLESMLNDYNDHFTPVIVREPDVSTLTPLDPGFNPKMMLLDKYIVSDQSTLNLCAPPGCNSYKWEIQDPETKGAASVAVKTMDGTNGRTQRLVIYLKDSRVKNPGPDYGSNGLEGGKTYRLCLSAFGDDGREFYDYATLAVYKDYYFETGIITLPERSAVNSVTSSARSVLPEGTDLNNSGLHYYLYAENLITGEAFAPFEVNISKDISDSTNKSGNFEFNLPKGNYFLRLMVCNSVPANKGYSYIVKQCQYIGFAAMDNRYNQTATFVLRPSVTSQAPGNVYLKVYSNGWDVNNSLYSEYEISTSVTDSSGAAVSQSPVINLTKANITSLSAPVNRNYEISLPPGTYTWTVTFKRGGSRYQWSDNVTVMSNKTTTANFGIPPLIPTGLSKFKIYTDGWSMDEEQYSGFDVDLSVTNPVTGEEIGYEVTQSLVIAAMTDTLPGSANFGLMADLGTYNLNVKFSRNGNTYIYTQSFVVEAGKTKTETVGIQKVIPAGTVSLKLFTDGWSMTDPAYRGYTASLTVKDKVGNYAVYQALTEFEAENLTDTVPGSANFAMYAEPGTYNLSIYFKKDSKVYTWSYQILIEAGKSLTETAGIPSSVIPLGP